MVARETRQETLFGTILEKNVYFLVDTSGSMYKHLPFVKRHLYDVLMERATNSRDTMFNIIEFKEEVDKWADKLVQCTPTTVNLAERWIEKLNCGTSTNTMAALLEATQDPALEAIYMVTDGLPDQRPTVILEKLRSGYSRMVPVHSIYLNGTSSSSYSSATAAHDFLRPLAEQTRGSCHVVTLSLSGEVERVVPVCRNGYVERYGEGLTQHDSTMMIPGGDYQWKHRIDLPHPPASEYMSRMYPRVSTPLPHMYSSHEPYSSDVSSCKILGYADSVMKAKDLATSVGLMACSTPVACTLMRGVKVLARYDPDGLYYLGEVKEQGPAELFVVKFDQCPAMRKTNVQETSMGHMIAYQDAMRAHVSLGDKVLAPWQQDGRYGPGTVLDGIDRRDPRYEGDEGGELLVTFFNGETVEVEQGVAVRICDETFERITRELQLPESQRRKLKFTAASGYETCGSSTYNNDYLSEGMSYKTPHPPKMATKAWQDKNTSMENDRLQTKIDRQLKENNYLLRALDLGTNSAAGERIVGKATSSEIPGYDSGIFSSDEPLSDNDWKTAMDDSFRTGPRVTKRRKNYDPRHRLRFSLPDERVLIKAVQAQTAEPKKPWRHCGGGGGGGGYQPVSRKTVLAKPREPGDSYSNAPPRPGHEEYQTSVGVSFPEGTDRKFAPEPNVPPHRPQKERVSPVWKNKHLKHSEYRDASGTQFPPRTDKKFTRSIDTNWRPETALANAQRQQAWQNGVVGHGDEKKQRGYFNDIQDKVAVDERKREKRIQFRRQKKSEREDGLAKAFDHENNSRANKIANRACKQLEIARGEQERTETVDKMTEARIQFRQERFDRYLEVEEHNDAKRRYRITKRETRRRIKEYERREEFHDRIRQEWKTEDDKAEKQRQKHEVQKEREEKRTQDVEQMKQARLAARQERLERYRSRIFPG